jgi:hypothetical protein
MHEQKSAGKPTFPTHETFFVDDALALESLSTSENCSQESEAQGEEGGLAPALKWLTLRSHTR